MPATVLSSPAASSPERGRVTVAIPTLNRPQTCAAAIRSALDQADVACDIVVSENCSDARHADAYSALFQSLPRRVRVLRRDSRLKLEDHFPFVLAQVTTPFVMLLADDDTLTPSFVARALALADSSGAGAVFGPYASVHTSSGTTRVRSFDYSHASRLVRALQFLCRRDDAFFYGLFRTEVLCSGLAEFRPLRILGQRTLTRIAYAPLLVCLLAAPYAQLDGEPVWVRSEDSVKNESYLGDSNVRKLLLLLGEAVLAARFVRVLRRSGGAVMAFAMLPVVAAMALVHCGGFVLQAADRLVRLMSVHLRRLVGG
jgi:glycosyltransferase involved in cell wall biosynthesis